MYTLVLACVLAAAACALAWAAGRRARSQLAGLPAYAQLPLIGNLHYLWGDNEYALKMVIDISKRTRDTMLPFVFWLGHTLPMIVFSDPDDVKTVTNTLMEKPYVYHFGREWLGNGLITAPAQIWKRNIKKLAGTFSATRFVEGHLPVFNSEARELVAKLRSEAGAAPFDIFGKYLNDTTLSAIIRITLGPRQNSIPPGYWDALHSTMELLVARGFNIFHHMDFIYRRSANYKRLMKNIEYLNSVTIKEIQDRRREREEMKNVGSFCGITESGKPGLVSLLDLLLELGATEPTFTEEYVKSELNTMIVSGQATIAKTMTIVLLLIGSRPDVQDKLYEEIKEVLGDSKRDVDNEDLSRLRYCEAVINEALRLYPIVPYVMRQADCELKLKSCTVPKGAICCINVWAACRAKYWGSDADQFNPGRWLDDSRPLPLSLFIPFSYGKRMCIGKKFSMVFLKTLLVHCVRELRFSSEAAKLRFSLDISLTPISGHHIQVL